MYLGEDGGGGDGGEPSNFQYLGDDENSGTVSQGLGEQQPEVCFIMNFTKGLGYSRSHDSINPGKSSVEDDHHQAVPSLGGHGLLAEVGEEGEAGGESCGYQSYRYHALPQAKPVVGQTPEDSTTSIENVLENGHGRKEVVVVDKSQSK